MSGAVMAFSLFSALLFPGNYSPTVYLGKLAIRETSGQGFPDEEFCSSPGRGVALRSAAACRVVAHGEDWFDCRLAVAPGIAVGTSPSPTFLHFSASGSAECISRCIGNRQGWSSRSRSGINVNPVDHGADGTWQIEKKGSEPVIRQVFSEPHESFAYLWMTPAPHTHRAGRPETPGQCSEGQRPSHRSQTVHQV